MTLSLLDPLRDTRFLRHYAEMVVAMLAGMVVLGVPAEAGLQALGSSLDALQGDAPWAALLGMATVMTIPMVALMRWRGHDWRPCAEMSASMYVPTFAAIALHAAGALGYMDAMMLEHVVMFPAMLGVMLLRPAEYAHRDAHGPSTVEGTADPAWTAPKTKKAR